MSHQDFCHWKDLRRRCELGLHGPPRHPSPPPTQFMSVYFKMFGVKLYRILRLEDLVSMLTWGYVAWRNVPRKVAPEWDLEGWQ